MQVSPCNRAIMIADVVSVATVRFNKVQCLFKLHLTQSNLTNWTKAFWYWSVFDFFYVFLIAQLFSIFQSLLAACLDLAASTICNETIYFFTRCNWRISIKVFQWAGTWMNLPKIAYVKQITGRFFFSTLQFSCNQSICRSFDGNEIDMLVQYSQWTNNCYSIKTSDQGTEKKIN